MIGMLSNGFQGPTAMVRLLLVQWNIPCRDAEVFYSDVFPVAIGSDQWPQRCSVKIMADIAVELTVAAVARITRLRSKLALRIRDSAGKQRQHWGRR